MRPIYRNGTPGGSPGVTPALTATLKAPGADGKRSISTLPKGPIGKRTFESMVANSVEIDLGDF